ncbi:flippase-like domain-containing protein [Cellulomonas fimi]|uniref:lysylphosphatidylglycerol synthase transmembrane domain-containing protein n=1 Tax=Cellulomonas fimi TaxID=1708 RepID=UPI00234D7A2F|nr:lysylphosphatidylglycerol synthase transmembrane domain-containing protein [Cellulomonas fimi]MDC7123435.1 flippase-like domain-containing protein [Cellulomonas fimi]
MSSTPPSGRAAAVDADRARGGAPTDPTVGEHGGDPAEARVVVEDVPTVRVHHPTDLLNAVLAAAGVVLVLALALYAPNTTSGVAEDVQGFASLLRRILFIPVQLLEVLVALVIPLAVLAELAIRRLGRQLLEGVTAAVVAVALNEALRFVIVEWGSEDLATGLSIRVSGDLVVSLPPVFAMVVALLTVAGPRGRRRSVDWSWNVVWISGAVLLVIGRVSLPGLVVSLLIGRVAGMVVRYVSGVQSERAYGTSLLDGIRRAGFEPARLARVADDTTDADAARLAEREGTEPVELDGSPASRALTRSTGNRVYELTTTSGDELDVLVIDGDRQVVGGLERLWRSIRMRGIEGRSVVSLRQATSRAALQAYAARAAGVRTPQLLSIAEAEDSMLLVQERPGRAVPLADLPPERLTDDLLREIWAQLQLAHAAGVAHRALTSDVVLVDDLVGQPVVWLVGWEQGDVASSDLARRMDVTQLVALLALRVGATRALESAAAVLPESDLAAVGPLLQTITLPRETRVEMRAHKQVLADLRTALVARLPEASVEPEQLVRFGARTVVTILLTVVAIFAILATINVEEIGDALAKSDWRWSVLAFALGMSTLVTAALAFVAFSPVRLPIWRATLVQTAATFVALAAPAGIGPAALNLRMLTKRGVSTTLSAATVALVQVSQFIVTLVLLLGLTIISGRSESQLPISGAMLVAIGIVAALVGASLLVPPVRQWVLAKSLPTLQRTWPRLIEVLGQPWRLALAVGGNLAMTLGYILAFDACLQALNQDASLIQVALVYLAGNTAGALVPTPGGMGAVEFALATTLAGVTGMNLGVATSIAVLFRALTYWLRIPFGWAAMRYLQRSGEL